MHREMRSPAAPLELKERRQAGGIGSAAAHASARSQNDSELSVAGRLQFSDVVDVDDRRSVNADERRRIESRIKQRRIRTERFSTPRSLRLRRPSGARWPHRAPQVIAEMPNLDVS
jgi:hypothetical protein